jgi:cell division protein ZapA (FtsZ GTPase activity inhibitor)
MSEEEIIEILKNMERRLNGDIYCYFKYTNYEKIQAIQGILDLYKQEKEKSKKCEYYEEIADELHKANQAHQKLNGELRVKIKKLEEENSMLKGMFKKSIN